MTVEPRTEAGKALGWYVHGLALVGAADPPEVHREVRDRIAAIESEARAAALREVAEKVRAEIDLRSEASDGFEYGALAAYSWCLSILTEATGASE